MRVPTLRNIALTAPYMHDGRFATLEAVLDHYARVAQLPTSDARLRSFNLSADERADLIAFLNTLTDRQSSVRQSTLRRPMSQRQITRLTRNTLRATRAPPR